MSTANSSTKSSSPSEQDRSVVSTQATSDDVEIEVELNPPDAADERSLLHHDAPKDLQKADTGDEEDTASEDSSTPLTADGGRASTVACLAFALPPLVCLMLYVGLGHPGGPLVDGQPVKSPAIALVLYLFLQVGIAVLAYRLRRMSSNCGRWFVGFLCAAVISAFKMKVVLPRVAGDHMLTKMFVFAIGALWECSNAVLVFGGTKLLHRHGITSYQRAVQAGLTPCQINFVDPELRKPKLSLRRSIHLLMAACFGFVFTLLLRALPEEVLNMTESTVVLEAEALAVVLSAFVLLLDVPSHLMHVWMDCVYHVSRSPDCSVQIILPYGFIYFSHSSRHFWSMWSRPASTLIRHLVYYPMNRLCGNRIYISIPVLFAVNAASHYDVSLTLVGDRAIWGWNSAFGVLALAVLVEALVTQSFRTGSDLQLAELPLWVWWTRFILAHVSLRVACYVLIHVVLKLTITDFV